MRRTSEIRTVIHRPCLNCGTLTNHTRCIICQRAHDKIKNNKPKPAHRRGSYQRRAKQVVAQATHCWLCGKGAIINDPFTADHVIAGDPESPLLPAHRSCNSRRGNRDARDYLRDAAPPRP